MCTVLVIDDEPMIRWSIEETLGAAGHTVVSAGTASEGLALLREHRPDVVFLDLRLPDGDGLAVLKGLKNGHAQHVAVIAMTAFEECGTAAEVLRLGARTYLRKPFNFDTLPSLVDRAVDRCPA